MKATTIHKTFNQRGQLSQAAQKFGLSNLEMCITYLRDLPYGRNSDRSDLSLVFKEGKGTCSSKHAALKSIAMEQEIHSVQLVLCIYKMNTKNTPGIGSHIPDANLQYIPEAHCYLDIDGEKIDITTSGASLARIEKDILHEETIVPEQVNTYKVNTHKKFVQDWLISEKMVQSFEDVWSIREHCIASLSTINLYS